MCTFSVYALVVSVGPRLDSRVFWQRAIVLHLACLHVRLAAFESANEYVVLFIWP